MEAFYHSRINLTNYLPCTYITTESCSNKGIELLSHMFVKSNHQQTRWSIPERSHCNIRRLKTYNSQLERKKLRCQQCNTVGFHAFWCSTILYSVCPPWFSKFVQEKFCSKCTLGIMLYFAVKDKNENQYMLSNSLFYIVDRYQMVVLHWLPLFILRKIQVKIFMKRLLLISFFFEKIIWIVKHLLW